MARHLLLCLPLLSAACAGPALPAPTSTPLPSPSLVVQLEPSPTPTRPPLRTPTPVPTATGTPLPQERPVVRSEEPAPNAQVQAGEVRIRAEVSGLSGLAQVIASLNALPVRAELQERDPQTWVASLTRRLDPGEYEVRLVVMDQQRRMTDHRWRFRVLPEPTPTPTETPLPSPTPTETPTHPPLVLATPTLPATSSSTPVALPTLPPELLATPGAESTPTRPPGPSPTPAPVRLSLVRGMRLADARAQLQRQGFQVQVRQVQSPAPRDIVVDQAPPDGAMLPPGATVTLAVSAGQ